MSSNEQRYHGLEVIAATLKILAWVVGALGFILAIFLSIAASALVPKVLLLMGGLLWAAITTGVLLALSEIIYLLIDVAQDIKKTADKK